MSLCVSNIASAQWTKPSAPASTPLVTSSECYLYNIGADGFLVGANDYGTRASVSQTSGYKVYLEPYTAEDVWDGSSYYITDSVKTGWMSGKLGYMFIDDLESIFVDNTKDGKKNNRYTFEEQEDGTYKIGLSATNADYNSVNYEGAYLGLIPEKADTRIYVCDPSTYTEDAGYDFSAFNLTWQFVDKSEYERYVSEVTLYNSAMSLSEAIEKAKSTDGVSEQCIERAELVYGDTESPVELLDSMTTDLNDSISMAVITKATVSSPVEILSVLGTVEQTFTDGSTTGWTMATNATNKQASNANNAKEPLLTGNHLENWSGGAFGTGKVYALLGGVPNGVYKLSSLAFTSKVGATYLYAGTEKTLVQTTYIDSKKPTEVMTVVDNDSIEFGLSVEENGTNWIGLDNVYLYYMGAEADSYKAFVDTKIGSVNDYEDMVETQTLKYYYRDDYDKYVEAKNALMASKTMNDITSNIEIFNEAYEALTENIETYAAYAKLYKEASDWVNSISSGSEAADLLADYVEAYEEEGFNGNNGAAYILSNGSLDTDDIKSETEYLEKIYKDAVATGMSNGDDCTSLLKNPNFAEYGGWTSAVGPTWPEGAADENGDITYPVFQAWNMICDIYQEVTGLQNGIYELNMQAAFRPGNEYTEENIALANACAYVNSYEKPVTCVSFSGADSASIYFSEGKYPVKVYGLVTDGTLKVGITNKVRNVEGCALWGGGVKLIFRAMDNDVLSELIEELMPTAKELLTSYCGETEIDVLQYAIENVDEDDLYNSLIDLKNAVEEVERGVQLYYDFYSAINTLNQTLSNSNVDNSFKREIRDIVTKYSDALNAMTYSNQDVEAAIENINELIVKVKMENMSQTVSDEPVDYTSVIVNANFDPEMGSKSETRIDGWTTTAMNGYKENSVSYNRAAFELSQKISGLPAGDYMVKVHSFYRAGYYDEELSYIANGIETHLTTLYAQTSDSTYSTKVMNLTEGATEENYAVNGKYTQLSNGLYVPDGTTGSVEFFAAGAYVNELRFTVPSDKTVTIGLSKTDVIANDYQVVGAWELWRLGDESTIPTEIQDTTDVTELIVNSQFEPMRGSKETSYIEGWTTSALNSYRQNTLSYSRSEFELKQTISGLSKGTYVVTVNSYYRAGYANEEEENIANGVNTKLDTLFAETPDTTYAVSVMNLSEGATKEMITDNSVFTLSDGTYVPDGTAASLDYFNEGQYVNRLPFYLKEKDSSVTIGVRKRETIDNDFSMVGEWQLYYYGKGNYIAQIEQIWEDEEIAKEEALAINADELVGVAKPVAYYTLSGTPLAAPQKGVNIVKMDNGMTLKMVIE